ncbi:MAG TPA: VOC family protein [Blastocatellia bacterium]|nr:VOC family protein [Blastocatellia bacterium]
MSNLTNHEHNFRLDHVVILVTDLAAAMDDYAALGFSVIAGGEHAGGLSHNALIPFQDGSYLELIAFKSKAASDRGGPGDTVPTTMPELWARFDRRRALGEGLVDFALAAHSLEAESDRARRRGLNMSEPAQGGRIRPDGKELRWLTALPPFFDLPFLIQDRTPRSLRVPEGLAAVHPNGAKGIVKVIIITSDLEASVRRYDALMRSRSLENPPGEAGAGGSPQPRGPRISEAPQGVDYRLENAILTLVSGDNRSDLAVTPAPEADRPYSITIVADHPGAIQATPALLHHARIEFSESSQSALL